MNIAEWSIRNSVITWVLTVLLVAVGWLSFNRLSRLEDPEFTIKDAVIITPYPGASAAEVAEEVTNVVERAVQEMGQLDRVESRSSRDLSIVQVTIKDNYNKATLPQVWDELRRKVGDYQRQLPPGAGPSLVNDDFGDVYGVFLAITGEGYTDKEVYEYAKFLQRELLKASDVKRIIFYGVQPEVIYIEMRREKMAEFGVSPDAIYSALQAKNVPVAGGRLSLGQEFIPISPTGEFTSEQAIGDLLVRGRDPRTGGTVFLRDVADIRRGYQEPPQTLLRYDGKPAIGLAISTVLGGNVITMGESLEKRLGELEPMRPVGMDLNVISLQSRSVIEAIGSFVTNLGQAVVIVVVVLLIFMGIRSGLIIGAVLLVTIMGTFIVMDMGGVTLERISLGALIIALGMLVDNAIVVADGMKVKMQQGLDALSAARDIVGQVAGPLLGGTLVAIAAFAAIGTSQDSTGEYCRTLFWVILISLTMSWFTAVTITPLLCKTFFKSTPKAPQGSMPQVDAYGGKFYALYRSFLGACIRRRWLTVGVVLALFAASVFGFGFVKNSFFPDSTRPQFYVDFWFPEGTDIRSTQRQLEKAETYLAGQEGVTHCTTMLGGSQVRFLLTFSPEKPYASFGQILVDVDDFRRIPQMPLRVQQDLERMFTDAVVNVRMFVLGPSTGGKIQLRLYGSDPALLRELGAKAEAVLQADPGAKAVRVEWREMSKVVRPLMEETTALRAGIERPDIARAFQQAFEGTQVGLFRERDELLPIVARSPEAERSDLDSMLAVRVWGPAAQAFMPVGQVLTGIETAFENAHLWRRDRLLMLRIHADPRTELPSQLMARVKPEIEKVLGVDVAAVSGRQPSADPFEDHSASTLPVENDAKWPLAGLQGYSMAWGGEAEDSARANARLASSMPVFFGLMVLIVLFLFNSIKKTLVIWLTVPLAIIGVTVGLLVFRQPFGFMALLGLMSLSGMLIKNAIVLIDEINMQLAQGTAPLKAVIDSGVSRLIPVSMAALTTILGMLPLVLDAFFVAMAVTIMFGLGFATVLTLIFVPVLYSIIFGIRYEKAD